MIRAAKEYRYRPTESKYKGRAHEMYITYDLQQKTRGGGSATYPKVKRVYIAGDVKDWKSGHVTKRTGREVNGVRIDYRQSRTGYRRKAFSARRDKTAYEVSPASVEATAQKFTQVVEVPEEARNVRFYRDAGKLPARYRDALQSIR